MIASYDAISHLNLPKIEEFQLIIASYDTITQNLPQLRITTIYPFSRTFTPNILLQNKSEKTNGQSTNRACLRLHSKYG